MLSIGIIIVVSLCKSVNPVENQGKDLSGFGNYVKRVCLDVFV